ncbi:3-keto-disaccharide hydrolase [Sphingomonas colocasiae]|uniref:DUF1080 domain-containing protein n=1 Tax=Sphingomonas colocasiae TaxID=1848973 RepID=A0ABS7PHQ8_9SPHN|nr:DUF1080 domain-containing protein [Sphingomonas colocasiae]MBY8820753.1 DUF1080 domain-containing protein [Sphingomonas colocasiae]
MTGTRHGYLKLAGLTALALTTLAPLQAQKAPAAKSAAIPAGFTPLFDGRTLKGWRGDPALWSVRDGAITGGSDQPIAANTFLIFDKPYANFEIRFKYRWLSPEGNSGLQFRSGQMEGNHVLTGLQTNVTPTNVPPERFGMLYNETGDRQEMALLGQQAVITRRSANGAGTGRVVRTVTGMVNDRAAIIGSIRPNPEWNEVVLIAYDNRMLSAINGLLAYDALDNDPVGKRDGLFGIQLHKGPSMWIQYKDIVIKPLTAMPKVEGRFRSTPSAAPAPLKTYKDSTRAALADVALPE